jgi:uncharacterized protein (DUF1697 family)
VAQDIRYVALLRGINVGGKNIIKMPALKSCFEDQGFVDVTSYIQSGNVLFKAAESDAAKLTRRIEKALEKQFSYQATVVVRSRYQMKEIVERAPRRFGQEPTKYRYDVLFLMDPIVAATVLETIPAKAGVDEVSAGRSVLYFSRLLSKATESRLSRVVALPIYKRMTIRNWNTTTKLLDMMKDPSP